MPQTPELPVNAQQAAKQLGLSTAYISAIKRALGLTYARYIFVSEITKFLRTHPGFRMSNVYANRSGIAPAHRVNRAKPPNASAAAQPTSAETPGSPPVPVTLAPVVPSEAVLPSPVQESAAPVNGARRKPHPEAQLSHVARVLLDLMERHRISGKEITRRSEVRGQRRFPSSYLSRILSGTQTYVAQGDVEALAGILGANPREQFAVYRARLEDEWPVVFRKHLQILCTLDIPEREEAYPFTRLSPQGRAAVRAWLKHKPVEFAAVLEALERCVPPPAGEARVRHFATTLAVYMEKNQVSGKEITRRTAAEGRRRPSSWLSRITSGMQTWMEQEALVSLVQIVSSDPLEQAELTRAYLYDALPPVAYPLVRVVLQDENRYDEAQMADLSLRGQRALLYILHRAPQPESLLLELARFAGLDSGKLEASRSK